MKRNVSCVLLSVLLFTPAYSSNPIYVSPLPDSKLINCMSTIAIRGVRPFAELPHSSQGLLTVIGTSSGEHTLQVVLSDDFKTLIAKPDVAFAPGEQVDVDFSGDILLVNGEHISPFRFSFYTTPLTIGVPPLKPAALLGVESYETEMSASPPVIPHWLNGNLPSDFPPMTITQGEGFAETEIYLSSLSTTASAKYSPQLIIANPSPLPRYYRRMSSTCFDFKWQSTGVLTYFDSDAGGVIVMDSTFTVVDTLRCGNGYSTDVHDSMLLPGGHALLMSYDNEPIRMDTVVNGGLPKAAVTGLIIQELDRNKNVVFQWRSWDYVVITEALGVRFDTSPLDYVHGNAIELDGDGNLLLSARHLCQIIKIDRETGRVIWRWGGKRNEFRNIGDTTTFSYQHALRRLPNGHFLMFDNGNLRPDPYSRVAEYEVDQEAKTATLVWEYRHNPDVHSFAMGYADRRADGTTLIGWGAANPSVTVVDSAGKTLFEMTFPAGVYSYRAYEFPPLPKSMDIPVSEYIPKTSVLFQNYPNPFNPSTIFRYELRQTADVRLVVYDILGREVLTLVNEMEPAGVHEVQFDGSTLASGTYLCRMTAGDYTGTKKLLLVR
jgi:hypothetical protein